MGRTLIIAEKPSVAANIAAALGASRKDGYFESENYYISYAFGHLYTLADTKDYNPEMGYWDLKDYPFVPKEFKYKLPEKKGKVDEGIKKQVTILKELMDKSEMVINACDSDREGALIFNEIAQAFNLKKPIKTLWLTSHTPKDVEKGMANLRDDMINLGKAGYCRQQLDWILGINLTVVYTLKCNSEAPLKVGRVVLPTLFLIFKKAVEIANFKSTPFYSLKAKFMAGEESYIGTLLNDNAQDNPTRFETKDQLIAIEQNIKTLPGTILKKESKESKQGPKKLFSLTDLQGHITSRYKHFSGDSVLATLQSLYEKKFVSYPRTASRHLDDSQVKDVEESLLAVIDLPELNIKDKSLVKFHTDKKVFDSSKVDSHPAIIPTYIVPDLSKLSEDEKIIYLEVVKRFVSQFMPSAVYDTLEMITLVGEYRFITRGKVLVYEGWKALYINQEDPEDEEKNQEDKITAKNLQEGDTVTTEALELKEGKTNPPKPYTEETLLLAMENCGKNVDNEEEVLKGFTIGTPATRADTIKKLIETGYVEKKGQYLNITPIGAKVIHFFPIKRMLQPEFTGKIEKTLKDIENGQYDSKVFMEKMIEFTIKNINDIKDSEIGSIQKEKKIIGKCPEPGCSRNVIETEKAYSCEGTRNKECSFTLWKDNKFFKKFGKKLTITIATDLVNDKEAKVKGMKSPSKEDVKFDALIRIEKNEETGYWDFKMSFDKGNAKGKGKGASKAKKPIKFKAKASNN